VLCFALELISTCINFGYVRAIGAVHDQQQVVHVGDPVRLTCDVIGKCCVTFTFLYTR